MSNTPKKPRSNEEQMDKVRLTLERLEKNHPEFSKVVQDIRDEIKECTTGYGSIQKMFAYVHAHLEKLMDNGFHEALINTINEVTEHDPDGNFSQISQTETR